MWFPISCTFCCSFPVVFCKMWCIPSSACPGTPCWGAFGRGRHDLLRGVALVAMVQAAGVHPVWGLAKLSLLFCRNDEFDQDYGGLFFLSFNAKSRPASSLEPIFVIRGFRRWPTSRNNSAILSHLAALLMQRSTLRSYNPPGQRNIINSCLAK